MTDEARLDETPSGLEPATAGWFVVNVRDVAWFTHDNFGSACRFESQNAEFPEAGFNIRVLHPGQPNCLYHRESNQEDFLVLAGECLLLVEGEERPLKAWDFVHCPPGTEHVFVGAGDRPCAILMASPRKLPETLFYPVSEVAQKHGASAEQDTDSPEEAYAPFGARKAGRPQGWDTLPWS